MAWAVGRRRQSRPVGGMLAAPFDEADDLGTHGEALTHRKGLLSS